MNRPTMLHLVLMTEILSQHSLPAVNDDRTFRRRVDNEGDGFAAITLPALSGLLEFGLENGFFPSSSCKAFRLDKRSTLPLFLGGLWKKIFNKEGKLLHNACPDAIYGIRQICNFGKKPKAQASERRTRAALQRFEDVEVELKSFSEFCSKKDPLLRAVSDLLWVGMFSHLTPESIICRHGPGATAERKSSGSRWNITRWSRRMNDEFPCDLHSIPNYGFYADMEDIVFDVEETELPVRVVTVPKTQKAPRIIAIEPSHVQFAQQGLMRFVTPILESHRLTQGSVHFSDQSLNRDGAKLASIRKNRATLDLSDASDRVHNALVLNIFENSALLPYMQACRSKRASLPGKKTPLELEKFASMGSAMCFPTEAMVFYTLIQVAYHYYYGLTPSAKSIERFSRTIDVFGDDLIVKSEVAGIVRAALEAFGLRVNTTKSFVRGFFRESCGGDYYRGTDVTPVYLRNGIPNSSKDSVDITIIESLVATSNQLYQKGLWTSCQLLRNWVNKLTRMNIPRSSYEGQGLFYRSALFVTQCSWNKALQTFAQRRICTVPVKVDDPTLGVGALTRAFLTGGLEPIDFSRSVRRGASKTKHRWVIATSGNLLA